jgi:hypothetical protein
MLLIAHTGVLGESCLDIPRPLPELMGVLRLQMKPNWFCHRVRRSMTMARGGL